MSQRIRVNAPIHEKERGLPPEEQTHAIRAMTAEELRERITAAERAGHRVRHEDLVALALWEQLAKHEQSTKQPTAEELNRRVEEIRAAESAQFPPAPAPVVLPEDPHHGCPQLTAGNVALLKLPKREPTPVTLCTAERKRELIEITSAAVFAAGAVLFALVAVHQCMRMWGWL